MPSLLLIEKYSDVFCDFFTVVQKVKVSYRNWRKALCYLTCNLAMRQFAIASAEFDPTVHLTNGLRKDKKAVIKFRVYNH